MEVYNLWPEKIDGVVKMPVDLGKQLLPGTLPLLPPERSFQDFCTA